MSAPYRGSTRLRLNQRRLRFFFLEEECTLAGGGSGPFGAGGRTGDPRENTRGQIRGGEPVNGVARGVDDDGALKLEVRGKIQRVLSGDVSLRLS